MGLERPFALTSPHERRDLEVPCKTATSIKKCYEQETRNRSQRLRERVRRMNEFDSPGLSQSALFLSMIKKRSRDAEMQRKMPTKPKEGEALRLCLWLVKWERCGGARQEHFMASTSHFKREESFSAHSRKRAISVSDTGSNSSRPRIRLGSILSLLRSSHLFKNRCEIALFAGTTASKCPPSLLTSRLFSKSLAESTPYSCSGNRGVL